MFDANMPPLEALWSLLNFSPDEVFTSVGQVEAHLMTTLANITIARLNVDQATACLISLKAGLTADSADREAILGSFDGLMALIQEHGAMVLYALERDQIALEAFLSFHSASARNN